MQTKKISNDFAIQIDTTQMKEGVSPKSKVDLVELSEEERLLVSGAGGMYSGSMPSLN